MSQIIPCRRITMARLQTLFEHNGIRCDRDRTNPANGLCLNLPPRVAGRQKPGVSTTALAVRLGWTDRTRGHPRHERIFLARDRCAKTLVFWSAFALNPSVTSDFKENLVLQLTVGAWFATLSLVKPDTLVARYGIPYEMGLYPEQIVDAAECFADNVNFIHDVGWPENTIVLPPSVPRG